ncbi:MAG: metallophosphoesterase, partial [Rhodothermales bacterium]
MLRSFWTKPILIPFLLLFVWASNESYGQESFRVAPYLQYGTKSSMVVLWETETPATTRVEYGKSRLGDKAPNLSQVKEMSGLRTMHEVIVDNLEIETKYFWRVVTETESGERMVSEPSTFRTNVKDSTAFGFLLYGDSQSNPDVWAKVAQLGWGERPNFALLAGDLVDRGGNIDDWLVEFFPPANVLMRRVPVYTALGNHEDDHEHYYQYMHNPPPEYHYTFKYGNAQFFIVDTNRPVSEGSEQYIWLEQELAKSTAAWKFVIHHHPPFSSEENDHGDTETGSTTYGTHARNLVPLYEHYGVDFCLFGHVHMYERTWPLLKGQVNQKNGVVYINSGGAGGGLEDFAPTRSWFTAKVRSLHHYGYFMVHDNTVQFQAIDEDG